MNIKYYLESIEREILKEGTSDSLEDSGKSSSQNQSKGVGLKKGRGSGSSAFAIHTTSEAGGGDLGLSSSEARLWLRQFFQY